MTSKYKPIVYAMKNYNLNSGEKFEPGPEFEPRISRYIERRIEFLQLILLELDMLKFKIYLN